MLNVKFSYLPRIVKTISFNKRLTIQDACLIFAVENEIDFNSVNFLYNGKKIGSLELNKKLSDFPVNKNINELNIMVVNNSELEMDISERRDDLNSQAEININNNNKIENN